MDNKIQEPMSFHAQGTTIKSDTVAHANQVKGATRVTTSVQYRTDSVKQQSTVTHLNKQQRGKTQGLW